MTFFQAQTGRSKLRRRKKEWAVMDVVDVLAKLKRLRENPDGLTEDDGRFVNEMVTLIESGQALNRLQLLRIVDMPIPDEEIPN